MFVFEVRVLEGLKHDLHAMKLDEESTEMFVELLVGKKKRNEQIVKHYLAGYLILIESEDKEGGNHWPCADMRHKMDQLIPVTRQHYDNGSQFIFRMDKPKLVFFSSTGREPVMCPSNPNLDQLPDPCPGCQWLQYHYDCSFAPDLTAAMKFMVDHEVFRHYELLRWKNTHKKLVRALAL